MSKLGLFCERVVEAGWLTALATVPLYFDVYSSRVFEPDKIVFLRCIVLIMLVAQAVVWAERRVGTPPPDTDDGPASVETTLRRWRVANPLLLPVVGFALIQILASITSIEPLVSVFGSYQRLQGTYTLFTYIALFFLIVANLHSAAQFNRLIVTAVVTSLPITLYGLVQHFQLDPLPWGGDVTFRVTSTMGNAIFLAAYLIMITPLTAARLISALQQARVAPAGEDVPLGPTVLRWIVALVGVNLLLAVLLLGRDTISGLWWAAPGFIGLFALVVAAQPAGLGSPRLARVEAVALAALLMLQIICVFLTQSRGPWLGLFAGGIVLVLLLELRGASVRQLVLPTIGGLFIIIALLLVFNLPRSPLARFRDVPYLGRLGQLSQIDDGTGKVRVLIWQGTYALMTQHPSIGFSPDPLSSLRILIGYGPETMYIAYNPVYPPALGDLESRNASPDRNHNDLLDYLVTTGLLGLVAYIVLVVSAVRLGWRCYRRSTSFAEAAILAGLIAALVAHLVETQTGIAIVATKTYFWVILALLVALVGRRELNGQMTEAQTQRLRPIAGGAPTTARPRKASRRGPVAALPPRSLPTRRPDRHWGVVAVYVATVVIGQVVLANLASFGSGSGQVLMFGAFIWLALALLAWALFTGSTLEITGVRPMTWVIAAVGTVVAAVAIVLNLNQLAADVYHKQGTSYDSQQRFVESTRSYAEAVTLAPDQSYYALFLGRAYLEIAKQAGNQVMTPPFAPTLPALLDLSPSVVQQLGRSDALAAAQVILEHARRLDPLDPDHYANLERLYRLWGETSDKSKLDQAVYYAALATTLSPHSAQLFDEWAFALLAQGKLGEAQRRAETATQLDPQYATAHVVLGDVYLEQHDFDRALTQHQEALTLDRSSLSDSAFEQRVTQYVDGGKGQSLANMYGQLAQAHPDAASRLAYGFILSRAGQAEAGIAQFQLVVQSDPQDWVAWRDLAMVYNEEHDSARALAAANNAVQFAPADQRQSLLTLIASLGPNASH